MSLRDLDPFGILRRAVFDAARGRCEARTDGSRCREAATDLHHRLPKGRGAIRRYHPFDVELLRLLADGETVRGRTRHLAALCVDHHRWAHDSGRGYEAGLLVPGYARRAWDGEREVPYYHGPDPELTELWPHPDRPTD